MRRPIRFGNALILILLLAAPLVSGNPAREKEGSTVRVAVRLGGPGWAPASADYDGDGWEDPAVYREGDGAWTLRLSGSGYEERSLSLGGPGSIPVR